MAIKTKISADGARGAGYGQLTISGLGETTGPIKFLLKRNQGTEPYLGKGRMWQASESWHAADEVRTDSGAIVIPVGPDIVDAIVSQSANVAYLLTVAAGATKQVATLTVHRPLLGSGAAAPDDTAMLEQQQREEEARPAREAEEETVLATEDEGRPYEERAIDFEQTPQDPQQSTTRRRWPVIVALLALLALIGGGAGVWFGCLISGFGPPACKAELSQDIAIPKPAVEAEPPGKAELSCAGLTDGNACFEVAQKALEQKQLEPARQLFQQAAALGSVEASIFLGRMYDPGSWSPETSPAAAANWETAVHWYETAARQGDGTGQLYAGKLLCQNALTEFEKTQGRNYLDQASKAGNAKAQMLLADCQ